MTFGEVRGNPKKSGELLGKSEKLPANLWTAPEFHRSFGEVAGELLGMMEVAEAPGKSDSLPATRQNRLQDLVPTFSAKLLILPSFIVKNSH